MLLGKVPWCFDLTLKMSGWRHSDCDACIIRILHNKFNGHCEIVVNSIKCESHFRGKAHDFFSLISFIRSSVY